MIGIEPNNAQALLLRAKSEAGLEHFKKAKIDLELALQIDPTNK